MVDRLPKPNMPLSLIVFVGKPYAFAAVTAIYNQKLHILKWLYSPLFSGRHILPFADMYAQLIAEGHTRILSLTDTDIHVLYLTYGKTLHLQYLQFSSYYEAVLTEFSTY